MALLLSPLFSRNHLSETSQVLPQSIAVELNHITLRIRVLLISYNPVRIIWETKLGSHLVPYQPFENITTPLAKILHMIILRTIKQESLLRNSHPYFGIYSQPQEVKTAGS